MSTPRVQIQHHVLSHLLRQVDKAVQVITANLELPVHHQVLLTMYLLHQMDKAVQAITANKDACA